MGVEIRASNVKKKKKTRSEGENSRSRASGSYIYTAPSLRNPLAPSHTQPTTYKYILLRLLLFFFCHSLWSNVGTTGGRENPQYAPCFTTIQHTPSKRVRLMAPGRPPFASTWPTSGRRPVCLPYTLRTSFFIFPSLYFHEYEEDCNNPLLSPFSVHDDYTDHRHHPFCDEVGYRYYSQRHNCN